MRCLLLKTIIVSLLVVPAAAAQSLPGEAAFAASLSQIADSHDTAGMAVIGSCGSGQAEVYLGQRDIARNLPVNADTHFRIASVSKLITALAILHLHDEGALDLHQSAGSLLGFPLQNPAWPLHSIRIIDLLTHQSSIQDGSTYAAFLSESYTAEAPPPISSLLVPGSAWYAANNWRTEAPGSFFMYSNLNYGLLGSIIEAVTGQRFDRYMRDVFLPMLGIEGSFNPSDLPDINQLAVLYRKPGGMWTPQFDHFQGVAPADRELPAYVPGHNGLIFAPQGGLRTTAQSLMQLARFLQQDGMAEGEPLITEGTMAYLLEPQWVYSNGNGDPYFGLYYAFGAGAHHTTNRPGEDVVVPGHFFAGHPGAAYGLASNLYFRLGPEEETAILVITNGVGTGFQFDARSAFYTIETDIFEAYAEHILAGCITGTNLPDEETGLNELPADFRVMPPFPNPFNSSTLLLWEMAVPAQMHITLHDPNGRLIRTLANQAFASGRHTLPLVADDLSSGIFFVRFRDNRGKTVTVRLTHLK